MQNLFEKYGIKEVADVTFYRIEKKEETFESHREITAQSILKGAVELRTVYPLEDGIGEEDGFQAYVFTDATIINGTNYDCDDKQNVSLKLSFNYYKNKDYENGALSEDELKDFFTDKVEDIIKASLKNYSPTIEGTTSSNVYVNPTDYIDGEDIKEAIEDGGTNITIGIGIPTVTYLRDEVTGTPVSSGLISQNINSGSLKSSKINISVTEKDEDSNVVKCVGIVSATIEIDYDEADTGVFDSESATVPDPKKEVGTHEYTYAQQACMLFAKRQNLIAKTGVRYVFENADIMFGDLIFDDNFTYAPTSTERIVVVGLPGKLDESSYDLDEVNEAIKNLKDTIEAKAYDVTYSDYAELVVEDEMGYFNPAFVGAGYTRVNGRGRIDEFFKTPEDYINSTKKNKKENYDAAIAFATMWSDGIHYSINDAIDALKQKKLILDAGEISGAAGLNSIFGGYKVSSYKDGEVDPAPSKEDTDYEADMYGYKVNGETVKHAYNNEVIKSQYPLEAVINAVNEIGGNKDVAGGDLRVDYSGNPSNRAIYVRVDGQVDTAAGAYIYLLHNRNYKKLASDEDGIFKFNDKKGNTLYYQDKIFKGVEWLALVILGDKGLIFVVNRQGTKNTTRTAWMVNQNGYICDNKTKALVKNGLIHTTDITVNDETFEATCTVCGLKTHKTLKRSNRYTPVLFLDTLKVSTLDQTAEEVYAQGGKGNANLIGWDYGKEITLSLQDALFTPASMSAIFGTYEGNDFRKGIKETKYIDRFEPVIAKRSFIVPAGNMNGTPSEADKTAQAVFYDPMTMEPYADGTPIAEGEKFYKYTRSVAYEGQSIGNTIEISADSFPGTYKVVGDTFVRAKDTGEDERFQFIVPMAKMQSEQSITLEADGEPTVFDMNLTVLRPDDGIMVKFIQYDVVDNEEENDGSTMVKNTENLNLLDDAELFKISADAIEEESAIGATEY